MYTKVFSFLKPIYIFLNAISILLISNHNSFRLLFDKIASVYNFLWKTYLDYILPMEMASPGNRGTVPIVSVHFRSLL